MKVNFCIFNSFWFLNPLNFIKNITFVQGHWFLSALKNNTTFRFSALVLASHQSTCVPEKHRFAYGPYTSAKNRNVVLFCNADKLISVYRKLNILPTEFVIKTQKFPSRNPCLLFRTQKNISGSQIKVLRPCSSLIVKKKSSLFSFISKENIPWLASCYQTCSFEWTRPSRKKRPQVNCYSPQRFLAAKVEIDSASYGIVIEPLE